MSPTHHPRIRPRRAGGLAAVVAAVTAAGFAGITALVASDRTRSIDGRVRERIVRGRRPGRAAATVLGYTGKSWAVGSAAATLGALVSHRGRADGARAIRLSAALGSTASRTFDWMLAHRAPPPGRHKPSEQSYPSGHTLETAAVALVSAYVLWREGLAHARVAFPIALAVPLAEGVGRMYLDRHWATDVLGGLLGGMSVAALCVSGYEVRRAR